MEDKDKYWLDADRNIDINKKNNNYEDHLINPKMLMTKEELGLTLENRVPKYYKGKQGYEARKVCDNLDLSYHCGTAVTYILRAYHKHDTPIDCLNKAIAHLQFEIENYEQNN